MLKSLINCFKIPDLRKKLLITLGLLAVYRLGCFIPIPGINIEALDEYFRKIAESQGVPTLFGFMNLFTGGAFRRLTIFALGIMPYISASIIMQLLTAVVPYLEKLSKEGRAGYLKINQYARVLTLFLCIIQGFFIALWLENPGQRFSNIVENPGWGFRLNTIITLACGSIFIMWLGEQLQERGVGGISLIIAVSIISRVPAALSYLGMLLRGKAPFSGEWDILKLIVLFVIWIGVVIGVVLMTQAQRRVQIQYARRIVGRRVYGGAVTYLPIRVDQAGILAIIFAQAVLSFPATIATFFPGSKMQSLFKIFFVRNIWYNLIYAGLIIFFMYFYTAIVFNPTEISNNLKKSGGFIPGVRPGRQTADFLDYVVTRITFVGALYIAFIALFPDIVMGWFKLPSYMIASFFGGTTLLIVVGVMLDTMRQIESQLLLRHYEGFTKSGRLRGRRW